MSGPALVILAGGASSRLGACKALVDLAGATPLARLLAAGCDLSGAPALVIAGADHAAIAAAAPAGVEVAQNEGWRAGRTGSGLCRAAFTSALVPRGTPKRSWLTESGWLPAAQRLSATTSRARATTSAPIPRWPATTFARASPDRNSMSTRPDFSPKLVAHLA